MSKIFFNDILNIGTIDRIISGGGILSDSIINIMGSPERKPFFYLYQQNKNKNMIDNSD